MCVLVDRFGNGLNVGVARSVRSTCFEHYALVNAPSTLCARENAASSGQYLMAALSASFVGTGLVRFAYAPLLPALINRGWFPSTAAIYLGAANQVGYLLGALLAGPAAKRINSIRTLQGACVLASLSLLACASPVSVAWFFVWRLLSGVSGGAIVVLFAPTILSFIPENRRGVASGTMFLGLGLGIVTSGTVIPSLLQQGLRQTWLALAGIASLATAATWRNWPSGQANIPTPLSGLDQRASRSKCVSTRFVYAEFMAISLAPLAPMMFLADFVVRSLHVSSRAGSACWILYGIGATLGPLIYGSLVDNAGVRTSIPLLFLLQGMVLIGFVQSNDLRTIAALSVLAGTFPSGIIPLALAWLRELFPGDLDLQNRVWTRSAVVVAISQALAGYTYSAILTTTQMGTECFSP